MVRDHRCPPKKPSEGDRGQERWRCFKNIKYTYAPTKVKNLGLCVRDSKDVTASFFCFHSSGKRWQMLEADLSRPWWEQTRLPVSHVAPSLPLNLQLLTQQCLLVPSQNICTWLTFRAHMTSHRTAADPDKSVSLRRWRTQIWPGYMLQSTINKATSNLDRSITCSLSVFDLLYFVFSFRFAGLDIDVHQYK